MILDFIWFLNKEPTLRMSFQNMNQVKYDVLSNLIAFVGSFVKVIFR